MLSKKKIVLMMVVYIVASMVFSGCSKKGELTKEDYMKMYNTKVAEVDRSVKENETLRRILYTFDKNLAEVQGLTNFEVLPTGQGAYVRMNDMVTIDSKLDMGQSVVVPNQTKVSITNSVFFTPSQNWTFALGNGSVKMSHTSGIYGSVEVYTYNGSSNAYSLYEDLIEPHIQDIQVEELSKKVLFLGSNAGTLVESRMYVKVMNDTKEKQGLTGEQFDKLTGVETEASVEETSLNNESESNTDDLEETSQEAEVESESTKENSSKNSSNESLTDESTLSVETIAEAVGSVEEPNYTIVPYRYVCGVAISDYSSIPDAVVFQFFYPETSDISASNEIINTTLKSIVVGDNSITLE